MSSDMDSTTGGARGRKKSMKLSSKSVKKTTRSKSVKPKAAKSTKSTKSTKRKRGGSDDAMTTGGKPQRSTTKVASRLHSKMTTSRASSRVGHKPLTHSRVSM